MVTGRMNDDAGRERSECDVCRCARFLPVPIRAECGVCGCACFLPSQYALFHVSCSPPRRNARILTGPRAGGGGGGAAGEVGKSGPRRGRGIYAPTVEQRVPPSEFSVRVRGNTLVLNQFMPCLEALVEALVAARHKGGWQQQQPPLHDERRMAEVLWWRVCLL